MAVGDNETIAVGRVLMVTFPFAACTVAGNDAATAAPAGTTLGRTGAARTANRDMARVAVTRRELLNMIILHRCTEDEVRPLRLPMGGRTNRPSSEDWLRDTGQASGLAPVAGASPLRDSAGIRPDFAETVPPRHRAGAARTVAHRRTPGVWGAPRPTAASMPRGAGRAAPPGANRRSGAERTFPLRGRGARTGAGGGWAGGYASGGSASKASSGAALARDGGVAPRHGDVRARDHGLRPRRRGVPADAASARTGEERRERDRERGDGQRGGQRHEHHADVGAPAGDLRHRRARSTSRSR